MSWHLLGVDFGLGAGWEVGGYLPSFAHLQAWLAIWNGAVDWNHDGWCIWGPRRLGFGGAHIDRASTGTGEARVEVEWGNGDGPM